MREVFSKFIIEGENLIMAKCVFHKELAVNIDDVKGGGAFMYDSENKQFIFSGKSHDFGPANLEDIKRCVQEGKVFGRRGGTRSMNDHKFVYNTGSVEIKLN
jgi:hypothetical protein